MRSGIKAAIAMLALAGCVNPDAGCSTYGLQRGEMPPLPNDDLGAWVAVTDAAMTRACKG